VPGAAFLGVVCCQWRAGHYAKQSRKANYHSNTHTVRSGGAWRCKTMIGLAVILLLLLAAKKMIKKIELSSYPGYFDV
jgi:TRAP-type mannitol/chloroaromatic compound transport system permease small subunit